MIKEIIYDYYKRKESDHKSSDNFAPSYLTDCRRKIYYKKKNVLASNPIPESGYLKMDLGNATHLMLQDIFKKMGIWIEGEDFKEIEMFDLKWVYRIDGLLLINNIKCICEIKSVYANGFSFIEKEPKPEHLLQIALYMLFEKIYNGVILYIGRDNGFIIEYFVEWKDGVLFLNGVSKSTKLNECIESLKILKNNLDKNELPNRNYEMVFKNTNDGYSTDFVKDKIKYKSAWQCSYCQWRDHCWQNIITGLKNHNFYIDNKYI